MLLAGGIDDYVGLDAIPPIVTAQNISISGATGTGGTYRVGNTVRATWNNTASGDNNLDIASVTVDFNQFGGGVVTAVGAPLQTYLNPTPAAGDNFGCSVAAVGNNALIGARYDDTGATDSGAAYLFDGSTGVRLRTFLNPTPAASDYFGSSVAAVGNNVLIGAYGDDTGASNAGAAYLFDGSTGTPTQDVPEPHARRQRLFRLLRRSGGQQRLDRCLR